MPIQVIINQAGPLPITATFEPVADEPMYLEVNGSVWSMNPNIPANVMVGIGIDIDGKPVGAAQIFSNQNQIHRAVVPAYILIQLGFGQHKLTLRPSSSATKSDQNDFYTAVIHY